MPKKLLKASVYKKRLDRIAQVLEDVDYRCICADGPVTPTRDEITDDELRLIYRLSTGGKGRNRGVDEDISNQG